MQLRDNDALSTINNERAGIRHERDFAHVNFLTLNFFNDLCACWSLLIVEHQMHEHAQWRRIVGPTLLTLFHIKGGFAQRVVDILEYGMTRMTGYRKYRL